MEDLVLRRTPLGVRGLKPILKNKKNIMYGRTPLGVRGLKLVLLWILIYPMKSHPARGAWIETCMYLNNFVLRGVAPRSGCVD